MLNDMTYIDTHAHLTDEQYSSDLEDVLRSSREAGVERILIPDVDSEGRQAIWSLCDKYPDLLRPMIGVHPMTFNDASVDPQREVDEVEAQIVSKGRDYFCAIGEIGLDYHYSTDFIDSQKRAFKGFCELALRYDMPINVHTRDAWGDMCELLEGFAGRGLRGVMHAFCDTEESYERIMACGDFYFSIGGVVTFKKSQVMRVVPEIPLNRLVLETDAPYLTPTPFRGTRNESKYLELICSKIAELHRVSAENVAFTTTRNARRIFRLG